MDIAKDFTTSFNELWKHKIIIVPTLLSLIIPSILILIFFYVSGLYDLSIGLVKLTEQYNQEKENFLFENPNLSDKDYNVELINYIGQTDEYKKGFSAYLNTKGYDWNAWLSLINTRNIILFVVFVLAILTVSFYLSCASFAIITLNIKNKEPSLSNTLELTNRFLLGLLSLRILSFLIIGLPILLGILIIVLFFFVNVLLGGIFTFLLVIGAIVYILFIVLRMFFATPIMFIEEKKPSDSIKISYNITRHHLKQVFIVFAVIYGITLFINSFVGNPLYESFVNLLITGNILKFTLTFLIIILFLVLEAFMLAFENMFFFYSYIDFKKVIK